MKILYFYPDNPLSSTQGNNARASALLHYFKSRAISIDLVGCKSVDYAESDAATIVEHKLADNVFLLKKHKTKFYQISYFFKESLPNFFLNRIKQFRRAKLNHQVEFNEILKNNSYDYIIISYSCWASLVKNNSQLKNAKLVIDTHDFLTSQFQTTKKFKLGRFFQKEIELLCLFDIVIAISVEENYIYSQFLKSRIEIIPHTLTDNCISKTEKKEYDIIYVASDNPHNRNGINWFLEKVFPLLNREIKICIIGKITHCIADYPNVEKNKFVNDLNQYYSNSKLAICPMFTGTGLKIKVVEAMSFGIPVVCNERGIDGLYNKTDNGSLVTNNPEKFAHFIHKLIEDREYYDEISNQSEKYFKRNHHIDVVYGKLDSIFN
ncbi:MAG TPA: glycosyltransferase family 4 protein [Flavobacterium sp.]|uniref:glycosyltransferase family 4 protein n=1 Tax=Flavobacterium sp. TaxID=239 RepID=UPI002B4B6EBA|nr:glycosyltransferase family 4 protein [Flavobacterium sp.]HLO73507.1 glycosyltransferase family 4 protein [Flavobacterium sp.]